MLLMTTNFIKHEIRGQNFKLQIISFFLYHTCVKLSWNRSLRVLNEVMNVLVQNMYPVDPNNKYYHRITPLNVIGCRQSSKINSDKMVFLCRTQPCPRIPFHFISFTVAILLLFSNNFPTRKKPFAGKGFKKRETRSPLPATSGRSGGLLNQVSLGHNCVICRSALNFLLEKFNVIPFQKAK